MHLYSVAPCRRKAPHHQPRRVNWSSASESSRQTWNNPKPVQFHPQSIRPAPRHQVRVPPCLLCSRRWIQAHPPLRWPLQFCHPALRLSVTSARKPTRSSTVIRSRHLPNSTWAIAVDRWRSIGPTRTCCPAPRCCQSEWNWRSLPNNRVGIFAERGGLFCFRLQRVSV